MRELTSMELDAVSGGGFFSRIGASVVGGVTGLIEGAWKGGVSGGNAGPGLLGMGSIAAGVGMICGGVLGLVGGVLYGVINDATQTTKWFDKAMESLFDPSSPAPR
ncbi:hypothetical protein [Burkholderia cepacia]|uniref:Colicin V synthesis protein n=1 Tax=Burkholderia cepacia GG4 TaxID=1009846 RepID=A0A9W3JXB5_BURCE|nr:hypothetical protein [Burkholderia cepacia]AFQ46489.1 hypothetical protein GEM_0028 [Burkholderia cepacia GG4]